MANNVAKLVEDSDEDADLFQQLLELTGEIKVEHIRVRPGIADYADMAADPETGAVIVDERLGEYAGVNYTGMKVAEFLRGLRPELPIYILTNYANEIPVGEGGTVENIVDKNALRKAPLVHIKRILRAMQQYEAALTEQQQRFRELIDRKLSGDLDESEEIELQQLRVAVERPFASIEIEQERQWEKNLQRQEEQLARLEKMTQEIQLAVQKGDKK
jgi:hypothetical protein